MLGQKSCPLVPSSPGINDVINTSGDMISNGSDAAKRSIPVFRRATLDHMLRVDVGNSDAKQNQEILSTLLLAAVSSVAHLLSITQARVRIIVMRMLGLRKSSLSDFSPYMRPRSIFENLINVEGHYFLQLIKRRM